MAVIGNLKMMQKKRKIIQINVLGKTCSTGRTTWELHEYLKAHGFDSKIVTALGKDCPESFSISNRLFRYVDRAFTILTGLEGYGSLLPTIKLLIYLYLEKPDIVQLRNLHESYVNVGILLWYLSKFDIPTVVTLHDSWFYTGKCASPDRYNCQKWRIGCENCPAIQSKLRKSIFDFTNKMWRDKKKWFSEFSRLAVIGNSKWTTKKCRESFLGKAAIVDTVYNWIDQESFYPCEVNIQQSLKEQYNLIGKKIILAVASNWRIDGGKGFSKYLQLSREMPEEWQIVLIGKCDEDCSRYPQLLLVPSTNDCRELGAWYSAADVYLNLSESETFGKAAAEAVSCGTPLIALNRTANPEIVPDGGGCVIYSSDIKTIICAIKSVLENNRGQYISICSNYARKHFNPNTNMKKMLEIYEKLMEMTSTSSVY